jgi:hypothetical protein
MKEYDLNRYCSKHDDVVKIQACTPLCIQHPEYKEVNA